MCLLLLSLTIAMTCEGTPTICVAPACAVGEPTSVTCIFHKYVNVTKDNIVVTHYAFGTNIIDRDYPEASIISNIIVGVLLGASLIFNVYFLHKGGHLRIICRLLPAKQRDSKNNDIECTEQLVSIKENHLSQLPVGQYWSAVIVPERGNNSSQTDNVVETTDASVLALHRPDDNPKPKPSNSTTGNALEIFPLSGQTTKPPVAKNQGMKPKRSRGYSHPPLKNDNVYITQQVEFNNVLDSPSDQVHPKGNTHHDPHGGKKKKPTRNPVGLWRRAKQLLKEKEKSSTGNVLEKEDAAYRQTGMKQQPDASSLHSHVD